MKVAIIGAGAMGSLFGALLAEAGNEVHLLCARREYAAAVNSQGIRIQRGQKTRVVSLAAASRPEVIPMADFSLIFVKSPDTLKAAEAARQLTRPDGWVVTLQNGMGNAEMIAETISEKQIIAGTTAHGATLLAPGRISHAGMGPTVIGMLADSDSSGAHYVAQCFNSAGIETQVTADLRQVLWEKLLVNVGINAITALTGVKNGAIADIPAARRLCEMAVAEAAELAAAKGIDVPDNMTARVLRVARSTAGNRSSMGQDVDRRKRTEIGVINGTIVKQAEALGMDVPVNRTLTALVEILEAGYRPV